MLAQEKFLPSDYPIRHIWVYASNLIHPPLKGANHGT